MILKPITSFEMWTRASGSLVLIFILSIGAIGVESESSKRSTTVAPVGTSKIEDTSPLWSWKEIDSKTDNSLGKILTLMSSNKNALPALNELQELIEKKEAQDQHGSSRFAISASIGAALTMFMESIVKGGGTATGSMLMHCLFKLLGLGGNEVKQPGTNITINLPTPEPLQEFNPFPDGAQILERPSWCATECNCPYRPNIKCPIAHCPPAIIHSNGDSPCTTQLDCPPDCSSMRADTVNVWVAPTRTTLKPSTKTTAKTTVKLIKRSADDNDDDNDDNDKALTTTTKKPQKRKAHNRQLNTPSKKSGSKKGLDYFKMYINESFPDKEVQEKFDETLKKIMPQSKEFIESIEKLLEFFGEKSGETKKVKSRIFTPSKVDIQKFLENIKTLFGNLTKTVKDLTCYCENERCIIMVEKGHCDYSCQNNPGCPNYKCACRMPSPFVF